MSSATQQTLESININSTPQTPHEIQRNLLESLASACRLLGSKKELDGGISSQITVRDTKDTKTYWTPPFKVAMALVQVSDLIRINSNAEWIEGSVEGRRDINRPGILVHIAIHEGRSDVNAIAHSHGNASKALSTLFIPFQFSTPDDISSFNNSIAYQTTFRTPLLSTLEVGSIANTLSDKKAILLHAHGLLTVADTVDTAMSYLIYLDKIASIQLKMMALASSKA